VGLSLAQNPPGRGKTSGKGNRQRARPQPVLIKKGAPNAADPLAKALNLPAKGAVAGPFHYTLKVTTFDGTQLSVTYYPTTLVQRGGVDTSAPVLLLVHEKGRSSKDFEEPISELKGKSLAEHFQNDGYAVVSFDLRGHGANPRRAVGANDWRTMMEDLQAVYQLLVDRNNRGQFNLAKFGVIALGEGANLAAACAAQAGGFVSNEGRVSDLAALVLVSPLPEGEGYRLEPLLASLAPRLPIMLLASERDAASKVAVKAVRPVVERSRLNKVELFPSSLHGYKLLWYEPKITASVARFLDGVIKLKATEWEPRYNLHPVVPSSIQVVRDTRPGGPAPKAKQEAPAKKADEEAPAKKADEEAPAKKAANAPAQSEKPK
jgi:pimeloyl-ACP methyl ester carboxylesterase